MSESPCIVSQATLVVTVFRLSDGTLFTELRSFGSPESETKVAEEIADTLVHMARSAGGKPAT